MENALPTLDDSTQTRQLLERIEAGDLPAVDLLMQNQRDYLRRLIELRMEGALRARVDPSDVIQETLIVVANRIDDFLERRPTSFRLWIRRKALERLIETRRRHLAGKRSVHREMTLSDASSMAVARRFIVDSPSQIVHQRDLTFAVRAAIEELAEVDREVILLRHVEELSNREVAVLLEISEDAASKRYGRALRRLTLALSRRGTKDGRK